MKITLDLFKKHISFGNKNKGDTHDTAKPKLKGTEEPEKKNLFKQRRRNLCITINYVHNSDTIYDSGYLLWCHIFKTEQWQYDNTA